MTSGHPGIYTTLTDVTRPKAFQIRRTVVCDSPVSVDIERIDQCVASFGVVSKVR